jgi:anaerobic ribonucleoside-triphosphate reductase
MTNNDNKFLKLLEERLKPLIEAMKADQLVVKNLRDTNNIKFKQEENKRIESEKDTLDKIRTIRNDIKRFEVEFGEAIEKNVLEKCKKLLTIRIDEGKVSPYVMIKLLLDHSTRHAHN